MTPFIGLCNYDDDYYWLYSRLLLFLVIGVGEVVVVLLVVEVVVVSLVLQVVLGVVVVEEVLVGPSNNIK